MLEWFGLQQSIQTKIECDFNNNCLSIVKINGSTAARSVISDEVTIIWKIYEKIQIREQVVKYGSFRLSAGQTGAELVKVVQK